MPITAAKKITAGSFIFLTYMSTSKLPGAMSKPGISYSSYIESSNH